MTYVPIELSLGQRVKLAMDHAGLSARDLEEADVASHVTLYRLLNDAQYTQQGSLRKLVRAVARETGVPYEWLLTGRVTEPPKGSPDQGSSASRWIEELAGQPGGLDDLKLSLS